MIISAHERNPPSEYPMIAFALLMPRSFGVQRSSIAPEE